MIYWPAKASAEKYEFAFDFTPVLQTGEHIASRIVTAIGVTKDSDSAAGGIVTVWLSGGTLGTSATVTCTITTDSSPARVYSETAVLLIGEEPITLDEAKAQVRYFESDRDSELLSCIAQARAMVEKASGCILVRRQVSERFRQPQMRGVRLGYKPVVGDVAVSYTDASGSPATYSTARLDDDTLLPALGETWPYAYSGERFLVTYTAGFSVAEIPQELRAAMLMAINSLFEKRPMAADEQRAFDTLCGWERPVLV